MSVPPAHQPARPSARTPILVTAIVALLAGALFGVAGGYLAFGGATTSGDDADRAQAHVEHGCALTEYLDDNYTEEDLGGIDEDPVYWEAPAAGHLLVAAAKLDSDYAHLEAPGMTVIHNVQTLNIEDLVTEAAQACAEL